MRVDPVERRASALSRPCGVVLLVALGGTFGCGATSGDDCDCGADAAGRDAAQDGPRANEGGDASVDGRAEASADAPHDGAGGRDSSRTDAADSGPLEGGGPSLTSLRVTASSDGGGTDLLVPTFSPGVFDYYVRCGPGSNALTVSMTASSGAETALVEPTTSPSLPSQTLPISVDVNAAIVATATMGKASNEYWVRCLPPDFPRLQWTPHPSAGTPTPGYYLIGSQPVSAGVGYYAIVLDPNGVPVWYQANGGYVYDVDHIVSGSISWASPTRILDLTTSSTTYITANGSSPDAHELQPAPGGDFYVISSAEQTGVNLTGLTLPLYDGGVETYGKNSSILACDILEVDTSGNVVWTWIATDHFDPVTAMALKTPDLTHLPPIEPFHCNSIDVDPANGNLLVSARDMNSIFYIERSTGNVLWKMGGSRQSKDHAVYIPTADPFVSQHDARLQPGWTETCAGASGQVSVFDDEYDQPGPARGVLYDVIVQTDAGPGADCGPPPGDGGATGATVAFQYKGKSDSAVCGSFRILADGSRVIGWGQSEAPTSGAVFTELDEKGNDLLDLTCPDGTGSYRAIKIPLSAFPITVLRSTSGM